MSMVYIPCDSVCVDEQCELEAEHCDGEGRPSPHLVYHPHDNTYMLWGESGVPHIFRSEGAGVSRFYES